MTKGQLIHISANTNINIIKQILDTHGCVVIDNILNDEQLFTLNKELTPHLKQTQDCKGEFFGYKTKRISSLMKKSKTCQEMAIHPTVTEIMDHFLKNEFSDQYQLNLTQAIAIGPNEDQQIIHRDDPMFPFLHSGYEAMINCMWALDDFTEDNGATHIVPGSHKWERETVLDTTGKNRIPQPEEIIQATMKKGSVLVYMGSLYHGGGANVTHNQVRRGVVISYSLGWLKQAENSFLAYPLDIAQNFPEQLQKLLGYFVHTPNLGCVEGQDPIHLLRSGIKENDMFQEFLPEEAKELIREYKKHMKQAA